jgi:hypothetical protein
VPEFDPRKKQRMTNIIRMAQVSVILVILIIIGLVVSRAVGVMGSPPRS